MLSSVLNCCAYIPLIVSTKQVRPRDKISKTPPACFHHILNNLLLNKCKWGKKNHKHTHKNTTTTTKEPINHQTTTPLVTPFHFTYICTTVNKQTKNQHPTNIYQVLFSLFFKATLVITVLPSHILSLITALFNECVAVKRWRISIFHIKYTEAFFFL